MDGAAMKRTLSRIAHEVLEANGGAGDLVVVGILKKGWPIAKRLAFEMTRVEGITIPCGKLDATGSRDDRPPLTEDSSEIPFQVAGKRVILVDEVIYTGRTVRAALDTLMRHGRPQYVRLAVLVDRGHRELPVQPDFVGRAFDTRPEERVIVRVAEYDGGDAVLLQPADES